MKMRYPAGIKEVFMKTILGVVVDSLHGEVGGKSDHPKLFEPWGYREKRRLA